MNPTYAILAVGVLAVAAYFIAQAISSTPSSCSGIESINPFCYITNIINNTESEIGTIVIVLVLGIVAIVALLAYGKNSSSIVKDLVPSFHA